MVDGYAIINSIRIGLNIMTFVVMPLAAVVVSVFAIEAAKLVKINFNKGDK